MANKRMFTMNICDSDAFLDMPLSSQCLYFHLNMRADDDGFIDNPKRIMKIVGASEDDLKMLILKSFVLTFDSGVIVIKHWRMHNTLGKQRYHETQYLDEKSMLLLKENGSYSFNDGKLLDDTKIKALFERRTSGEQVENADLDIDLDIDKDIDIKEKDNTKVLSKKKIFVPPTVEEVSEYCNSRNNGIDANNFIDYYSSKGWMIGKNKMKDWKAAVRTWERNHPKENGNPFDGMHSEAEKEFEYTFSKYPKHTNYKEAREIWCKLVKEHGCSKDYTKAIYNATVNYFDEQGEYCKSLDKFLESDLEYWLKESNYE